MVVLVICRNDEDPNKSEGARVTTRLYIDFSDTQGQLTPLSVVGSSRHSNLFKIKNEGARVVTR